MSLFDAFLHFLARIILFGRGFGHGMKRAGIYHFFSGLGLKTWGFAQNPFKIASILAEKSEK